MRFYKLIVLMSLLAACSQDKCKEYSEFSCEEIDAAEYNVYFYYPDNTEKFLGHANGLRSCGSIARSFVNQGDLESNNDWSYVCCMIAKDSQCYEKHR